MLLIQSRIMLNLPVHAREANRDQEFFLQVMKHGCIGTTQKLSNNYLTERAHHLHAQTRQVCSNVKGMLTLSFDIRRFVLYKFVPQGQTETTLTTLTCYDVWENAL
jgi:hypothetical protein